MNICLSVQFAWTENLSLSINCYFGDINSVFSASVLIYDGNVVYPVTHSVIAVYCIFLNVANRNL